MSFPIAYLRSSRARVGLSLVALALSLGACADNRTGGGSGRDGGSTPPGTDSGTPPLVDAGPRIDTGVPPSGCAAEALIHVIDRDNGLSRFDPRTESFSAPVTISCAGGSARPFSMSVDQRGTGLVLFRDPGSGGTWLDTLNTDTGACGGARLTPPDPLEVFGMGYAQDGATEALFVSGGSYLEAQNYALGGPYPASLYRLDGTASRTASPRGELEGWPELSGNALGDLFAFYPPKSDPLTGEVTQLGRIVQLDRANGSTARSFTLDALLGDFESKYAFAYWGGRLYVFIKRYGNDNSEVWRFNLPPEGDGSITRIVEDAGRIIVGAGVSTCAPVELI